MDLTPAPKYTLPKGEVNIHSTAADLEFTTTRIIKDDSPVWEFKIRALIAIKEADGHDVWGEETVYMTPAQASAVMALYTDSVEDDNNRLSLYKIAEPVFEKLSRPFWLIP